ncbi:DNA maturase A [Roseobacter phage CRP-171]|jgi:hypothetical protein|uniref:DNA maturase A n=1 Tax=Roseobacter phage CRP-171 TaxID=3072846 RepID=A0AAX3ZXU7_9CAUD|nr:DNA maturase A [Roseobacter phage CRP-171]
MSSQKELMEMLHKVLAEQLLARVSDPEAKASDLNVARQFLKDNNIDGVATEGSPLGNLVANLPDFNDEDSDPSEMRH